MFIEKSNIYYNLYIIHIFAQKYAKKWEADHNWYKKNGTNEAKIREYSADKPNLFVYFILFHFVFSCGQKRNNRSLQYLWGVKCFEYYFIRCVCVWFGFTFCFVVLQTMLGKNRTEFILLVTTRVTNCTFPVWSIAIYSSLLRSLFSIVVICLFGLKFYSNKSGTKSYSFHFIFSYL